jgi:hypothetical protein
MQPILAAGTFRALHRAEPGAVQGAVEALRSRLSRLSIRVENAFAWTPIQEVAILFAAIFLTMIPVLAILRAGHEGALVGGVKTERIARILPEGRAAIAGIGEAVLGLPGKGSPCGG